MGSFCRNRSPSIRLITAFSPGIPCACSSPRSLVASTPPAARPHERASCSSCWPRAAWISGCSRRGAKGHPRFPDTRHWVTPSALDLSNSSGWYSRTHAVLHRREFWTAFSLGNTKLLSRTSSVTSPGTARQEGVVVNVVLLTLIEFTPLLRLFFPNWRYFC